MKTIEQKAREYADLFCERCLSRSGDNCAPTKDRCTPRKRMIKDFLAGAKAATEWISIDDELPKNEQLILTKEPDSRIDLIRGWQLLERIKPFAVADFYTHWRPIELPE